MDNKRKAQMFVVTLIFMAELIFVVQQSLFTYSAIDVTTSFDDFPRNYLESVREAANKTVLDAPDCQEAQANFKSLGAFVTNRTLPRYSLDLTYSFDCSNWGNTYPSGEVLNLTVVLGSAEVELSENYRIYNNV